MEDTLYLAHHGIKGQKWGVRKYQYKDGSLTPEGRKRYGVGEYIKKRNDIRKARSENFKRAHSDFQRELADIDKKIKGTAQNKPVIRAAEKYDKVRKSVRQKYKSAVKAENKKLYEHGKNAIKLALKRNPNLRLTDIDFTRDFGKRKSNPWSEKPSNPYDHNWTERPSKNKSNI